MPDVADADQHGAVTAVHAEDRGDLLAQRGHVVAVALLPELAEAAEILADLGRGKAELLPKIERGDPAHAGRRQLVQLSKIAGKAADHIVGNLYTLHTKTSLQPDDKQLFNTFYHSLPVVSRKKCAAGQDRPSRASSSSGLLSIR